MSHSLPLAPAVSPQQQRGASRRAVGLSPAVFCRTVAVRRHHWGRPRGAVRGLRPLRGRREGGRDAPHTPRRYGNRRTAAVGLAHAQSAPEAGGGGVCTARMRKRRRVSPPAPRACMCVCMCARERARVAALPAPRTVRPAGAERSARGFPALARPSPALAGELGCCGKEEDRGGRRAAGHPPSRGAAAGLIVRL